MQNFQSIIQLFVYNVCYQFCGSKGVLFQKTTQTVLTIFAYARASNKAQSRSASWYFFHAGCFILLFSFICGIHSHFSFVLRASLIRPTLITFVTCSVWWFLINIFPEAAALIRESATLPSTSTNTSCCLLLTLVLLLLTAIKQETN